jgi:hypothetical protein
MERGVTRWNDREARWAREYRRRNYLSTSKHNNCASLAVDVPDDITVLTRDPSPCFMCGVRGGCRHRPWMLAEETVG